MAPSALNPENNAGIPSAPGALRTGFRSFKMSAGLNLAPRVDVDVSTWAAMLPSSRRRRGRVTSQVSADASAHSRGCPESLGFPERP